MSYPSEKSFSSYFIDFCERLKWIQNWWLADQSPTSYWISAFFHPCSFLGCVKLDFVRKYKISFEKISVDFCIVDDNRYSLHSMRLLYLPVFQFLIFYRDTNVINDGIFMHGLFLEAAHWNGTFLDEQIQHKTTESFPMVHIKVL